MQSKIPVQIKIIHKRHAMTALGPNRKSSLRADVFRFAPESRHDATRSVCPFRADFVAEIGIPTARDGWCIF
jgi:hypothetical protein